MTWTEVFCVLLAVTGLGLLAIGYMQANRRLKKDSPFGTKTWTTRASAKAWYEGNEAAAPYSYAQGVLCVVAGLVGAILGSPDNAVAVISLGVAVFFIMVLAGFQVSKANAAAEHADRTDTP